MPDLLLVRNASLFVRHPELRDELGDHSEVRELAQDELFHPVCPADFVVRLGRLRLTEFLPDGREVTHSVLQSGSCFMTRKEASAVESTYPLDRTTLMALGDAKIWHLPVGTLEALNIL
ncbi:hypothetical protein H8E07_17440 [bacterium]|nr:hypothetical protein [bacterium]